MFLGIFAALVAGVNLGRQSSSYTPPSSPTPTPRAELLSTQTCGISFLYPKTLTKIDIETGGATFVNTEKQGESIVIVCQKDIPRPSLAPENIETRQIGTVSAKLYLDSSQKEASPVNKLIFTHPVLNKDIYISGSGEVFDELIKTIQIIFE
jgi:hypothetical protein